MKKILLLLALYSLAHNASAQCSPSAFVVSLDPGMTASGLYLKLEAGIWPVTHKVGFLVGGMMYDELASRDKDAEQYIRMDISGRIIYKLTKTGAEFPQLITAFATVRGLVGVSYRAYSSAGDNLLIGIEPGYTNRLGVGCNFLITMRL